MIWYFYNKSFLAHYSGFSLKFLRQFIHQVSRHFFFYIHESVDSFRNVSEMSIGIFTAIPQQWIDYWKKISWLLFIFSSSSAGFFLEIPVEVIHKFLTQIIWESLQKFPSTFFRNSQANFSVFYHDLFIIIESTCNFFPRDFLKKNSLKKCLRTLF